MFTPEPIQRHAGPPASSTPARDYLNTRPPGVDQSYAVLPRSLVDAMPLAWQQQLTHLLADFHRSFTHLDWPVYRVVPTRRERLVDLDEDQLAEVGVIMEIDSDGDVVYRERGGSRIDDPEHRTALVSVLDPIPADYANANQNTPPRGFAKPAHSGPLPVQAHPGQHPDARYASRHSGPLPVQYPQSGPLPVQAPPIFPSGASPYPQPVPPPVQEPKKKKRWRT